MLLFRNCGGGGPSEKCTEPKEVGKCGEKLARWAFGDNKCTPFYYTGCEGNSNNYRTEDECQTSCPAEKGVVNVCVCVWVCPRRLDNNTPPPCPQINPLTVISQERLRTAR